VTIGADGGTVSVRGPRGEATPLAAAYADVFTGSILPSKERLTVFFTRSTSGEITGLRISDERTLGVEFERVK
jgi:hypothetical protein